MFIREVQDAIVGGRMKGLLRGEKEAPKNSKSQQEKRD